MSVSSKAQSQEQTLASISKPGQDLIGLDKVPAHHTRARGKKPRELWPRGRTLVLILAGYYEVGVLTLW